MRGRSFRWLPDTIVVRAVLILAGALLAMSLVGYWVYRVGAEGLATTARDKGLAERIVSIKRAVSAIPDEIERDKAAVLESLSAIAVDATGARLAANLDPYGQLIRMLLPRAQDLAVYATGGLPLWLANGVDEPQVQQLAAEVMQTGMSYTEIAKVLNKDEKSTDNALQRAKTKLRKYAHLPK